MAEHVVAPALLYHVDGMTYEQIALILGIGRVTVIKRVKAFAATAQHLLTT